MALPEHIEQHAELGVLDLAGPFWGKPRITSLLVAFLDQVQATEDLIHEMLELRTVDAADMARLKVLGKIVGQPRSGLDADDFRTLIKARALANVSRGRASDVFAVLELIVGATPTDYELFEVGNATLLLSIYFDLPAEELNMLTQVLPDVRAAGVGFQLLSSDDFASVFIWGDAWDAAEEWGSVTVL